MFAKKGEILSDGKETRELKCVRFNLIGHGTMMVVVTMVNLAEHRAE